ncbi:MAG: hypothetical protein R3C05_10885 [Pirellulaceae bacterium]
MKIVALDLGKFNSTMCRYDSKTRKAAFTTVTTRRDYLKRIFDNGDADLVVMEAGGPSGWISDLMQSQGLKTLVCSTNEEAWRWANVKRKTLDQRMNKTKNTIQGSVRQSRDRDRQRRTVGRTIPMNTKERSLARYQHTASLMLRSSL